MDTNKFANRHIGITSKDIPAMLQAIGVSSVDELIAQTIPADIRLEKRLNLPDPMTEHEFAEHIAELASKNKVFTSYIGMGWYDTVCPPPILRNVFENPVWYTSYTPYQAEVSQGRLEALFNFQTAVCELTGMPVANCSLLDEATAAAEAVHTMLELRSREAVKEGRCELFVDQNIFPQTLAVVRTRCAPLGVSLVVGDYKSYLPSSRCFGAIVQYPAANGELRDYATLAAQLHEKQILLTAVCDILSLALLKEPAAWGADIAVGSVQRFGLPMGFGGPHAAYMAVRDEYKRSMPGRIIGVSIDRLGNRALRMALQTREQHIKREKATSNLCTAQALLASMAGMFAVYHGAEGLTRHCAAHEQPRPRLCGGRASKGLRAGRGQFLRHRGAKKRGRFSHSRQGGSGRLQPLLPLGKRGAH